MQPSQLAAEGDGSDATRPPAAHSIPMPDLAASSAAVDQLGHLAAAPLDTALHAAAQGGDLDERQGGTHSWPAAVDESDFSNLQAPALEVQVS
jgi:hypothetical protein